MKLFASVFLLAFAWVTIDGSAIDNGFVSEPSVDCMDNAISIVFNTEKPFVGRVFTKDHEQDTECFTSFVKNSFQTKITVAIMHNSNCGLQKERDATTVRISAALVVSFHGVFITKVDRIFRLTCVYARAKQLTNGFEMSDMPPIEVRKEGPMPTCTYSIRSGSPNGMLIRYSKVGAKIFHVWECQESQQSAQLGILVHSCWVNNGKGKQFDLLDAKGCAVDPIIQPDLKYENGLTRAWTESHGYKFSDTTTLRYQCVVELCDKSAGECDGFSPPYCDRGYKSQRRRYSRSANEVQRTANYAIDTGKTGKDGELDLAASIQVMDFITEDPAYEFNELMFSKNRLNIQKSDDDSISRLGFAVSDEKQCKIQYGKGIVVILSLSALLSMVVIFVSVIRGVRQNKAK